MVIGQFLDSVPAENRPNPHRANGIGKNLMPAPREDPVC